MRILLTMMPTGFYVLKHIFLMVTFDSYFIFLMVTVVGYSIALIVTFDGYFS